MRTQDLDPGLQYACLIFHCPHMTDPQYANPAQETLDPDALRQLQRRKLAAMWQRIMGSNAFWKQKYANIHFDPLGDPLENLPFTTRTEIEQDQLSSPPY